MIRRRSRRQSGPAAGTDTTCVWSLGGLQCWRAGERPCRSPAPARRRSRRGSRVHVLPRQRATTSVTRASWAGPGSLESPTRSRWTSAAIRPARARAPRGVPSGRVTMAGRRSSRERRHSLARCNGSGARCGAQKKAAAGGNQSRQRPVRKANRERAPPATQHKEFSTKECSIGREGPTRGAGGGSAWDSAQSRCRKAESAAAKCKEDRHVRLGGRGIIKPWCLLPSIPDLHNGGRARPGQPGSPAAGGSAAAGDSDRAAGGGASRGAAGSSASSGSGLV